MKVAQDPLLFQIPFRAQVIGPSGAGKSTFIVNGYLLHPKQVHKRVIAFCHEASAQQPLMKKLREKFKGEAVFMVGFFF